MLKPHSLYGVPNESRADRSIALAVALLHSLALKNSPISPQARILGCPKHITCTVLPFALLGWDLPPACLLVLSLRCFLPTPSVRALVP